MLKDPLETRTDPYQRFNDEARKQGRVGSISPDTKPMQIRHFYGPLKIRTQDPSGLLDAYDRLTRVEQRLVEDIYFYMVDDSTVPTDIVPEPAWQLDQPVPLPPLPIGNLRIHILAGLDTEVSTLPDFKNVVVSPSPKYDEVHHPILQVTFDQ